MSTVGIVAEYNPFHLGHQYHIAKTKEATGCDTVVAVMSGNFVQRGEPAIFDKFIRARMAVENGVDLVLELPTIFACNNAEQFAFGSVSLLNRLSFIDCISFGTECDDMSVLKSAAAVYADESEKFKIKLKELLDEGAPYAKARQEACITCMEGFCGDGSELSKSNNILAVEYLKQLKKLGSKMVPSNIKRRGGDYNDLSTEVKFPSATAIRMMLHENRDDVSVNAAITRETAEVIKSLNGINKAEINNFFGQFAGRVIRWKSGEGEEFYPAGEGITNKISAEIRYVQNFDQLTEKIISKRYTKTRLQRLYMHILLNIRKDDYAAIAGEGAQYARVLGFSDKGARLIKEAKKAGSMEIPFLTNISKEKRSLSETAQKMLSYDILATDLYNLVQGKDMYENSDFVKAPFIK